MGKLKPINPTKAQIIVNPQAAAHDYNTLSNKPQINGVTLEGDKNSEELGLQGTITAEGYLSVDGGTLSFDDETFMVKRDALPKIGIRDANQSGFTPISEDDVSEYTTGAPRQIPVAAAGTFFRAYGDDVCTEMYQTVNWKLYVRAYKLVGEHWLGMVWREIGGSQIVSGVVNANGTITFTDSEGNSFTTSGESVIGADGFSPVATVTQTASGATISITDATGTTTANISNGDDYVLTPQDKTDIANIVLSELPTTQGVLYGNTSN